MRNGLDIRDLENIRFDNRLYPVRHLFIGGFGNSSIAGEKLQDALFTKDGQYRSEEARRVDESILFFVKDGLLGTMSDRQLKAWLNRK
jgi:hypothetical protein